MMISEHAPKQFEKTLPRRRRVACGNRRKCSAMPDAPRANRPPDLRQPVLYNAHGVGLGLSLRQNADRRYKEFGKNFCRPRPVLA